MHAPRRGTDGGGGDGGCEQAMFDNESVAGDPAKFDPDTVDCRALGARPASWCLVPFPFCCAQRRVGDSLADRITTYRETFD